MTSNALGHNAGVSLQSDIAEIVIGVRAGEFGMRRAVARLALQTAVPGRKPIQREALSGGIGLRRESGVNCLANCSVVIRENRCVTDLAVVVVDRAGVAALAARFHEPADPVRGTDLAHAAVAALALHFH